jgi:hypothetical protein
MQKNKLLLLVLLCCCALLPVLAQPITVYYTPVQKPAIVWDEYHYTFDPKDLAEDMAALLQQATGIPMVAAPYHSKAVTGIFLLLDSTEKYSAREAAVVSCNGSNILRIVSRYANGLSYGAYTYLDKLGFKFYLPGKAWTIVPKLASAFNKPIAQQEWKPYFKHRTCGISGGMAGVTGLDEKRNNTMEWYKWYRRNRMGSEYMGIAGHIGELFNMMHQKEIEKDPSIVAPEDGTNRKYSLSAKLDPLNEKGINLFANWIVQQYKAQKQITPSYMPAMSYQSVDPGDGLGYCHTPACDNRFKSVSDQAFYIANLAAKKIATAYPGTGVSLYAYTERTDTPSIKIEPNVHVEIVASAFHNVASPAALIARWAKKTKNLTLYDYINIGVWSKEEPFFNLSEYVQYLNYAKNQQINGFTFEAAPAKFSSGILQYFILKYLNEPYSDVQQEFEQFCRNCFGKAATPINQMMQEWYFSNVKLATNYDQNTFYEDELGRFFGYLEQASASEGSAAVQQRLDELKAYTVYLTKHFEYWYDDVAIAAVPNKQAQRKQKAADILDYTWKLYNRMIFHNTQFNDVMRWYFPEDAAFNQQWNYYTNPTFAKYAKPFDATADYRLALKNYLPKAGPRYSITDSFLAKVAKLTPDSIRLRLVDEEAFGMFRFGLPVYCPAPGKFTVQFEAGTTKKPNSKMPSTGFVTIMSQDYTYLKETYLQQGQTRGILVFDLPKKGHYVLWLAQNNATGFAYTIRPGKNLVYINKKAIPMNGIMLLDVPSNKEKTNEQLAFYVPRVDSVHYTMLNADCVNYVQLYNARGKALPQSDKQATFKISVAIPPTDANNFVFMANGVFRWPPVLRNVPPYYFFLKYPKP